MFTKKNVMSALFEGAIEYVMLFPLLIITGYFIIDTSLLWIWLLNLGILIVVGIVFRGLFSKQQWWLYFFVSLGIGILIGFVFTDSWMLAIPLTIIHAIFVYRGMMYVDDTQKSMLPVSYLWVIGLGIYFVAYFIYRFTNAFSPYLKVVTYGVVILVALILFATNRNRLKSASLSDKEESSKGSSVDRDVQTKNRLFIIITFLIIFGIASLTVIKDSLWNGFKGIVQWLTGGESSNNEGPDDTGPPPMDDAPVSPGANKEPGVVSDIFEKIALYAIIVVAVIAAVLIVMLFFKKARKRIKKMFHAFVNFLKQMTPGNSNQDQNKSYIDEKENLFSWKDWKEEQKQKAKGIFNSFKRDPKWHTLSNKEKVRFVYRKLLIREKEKFDYKTADTPRETLDKVTSTVSIDGDTVKNLKDAYEETRYGEESVGDDRTEAIRELLKKK